MLRLNVVYLTVCFMTFGKSDFPVPVELHQSFEKMCCGDGGSPYEFILAEHTHGHTIAMSLCGRERIPTTCYVKLDSAQPFHMHQHIVVNESIVLQNVPENCSQRPNLCDGQGRYGCLSGPCGVGRSCYKQDLIESSENWIYVDGQVEWRFDLLTLPSNLPDVNLIEIRLDNATFDDQAITEAWVVIDYNLPDWDRGIPYCPPLDSESSTANEIFTDLTSASDLLSTLTPNEHSTVASSTAKSPGIQTWFIMLSTVLGFVVLIE